MSVNQWQMTLLVSEPAPGTAFFAAEGRGEQAEVSIWSYLYGEEGAASTTRDEAIWRKWLASRSTEG